MYYIHQIRNLILHKNCWKRSILYTVAINIKEYKDINKNIFKSFCTFKRFIEQKNVPKPLRSIKPRAKNDADRSILDLKQV